MDQEGCLSTLAMLLAGGAGAFGQKRCGTANSIITTLS
jgi:hypothetical protein